MPNGDLFPHDQTVQTKDWSDDDEALLEFRQDELRTPEYFSVKDAFEGVQVFGATGSGKSSGSGQALALSFLESNFGGLVLTAKTTDRYDWEKYAAATGRSDDLLILDPKGEHRFNFLSYELNRPGRGAGHTENLVNLFTTVLEVADRKGGSDGQNGAFWQRAVKQLLRNAIDLLKIGLGDIDLPSLCHVITSAPISIAQADDPEWQKNSVCYALIEKAEMKASEQDKQEDFKLTRDYWLKEFANLATETRTPIISMFTSMADCFLRGLLRKLFCSDLNFRPEDCFDGKIILIDLPVKEFNELGLFSQVLFKYIWQRAVERRIPPDMSRSEAQQTVRPVFLFVDESQFFVSQYDALFQSTARSSRACTVYLTQNLPGYQASIGGPDSRSSAETFLGNLQTKIFHANGDPQTNNWAADSIGHTRQFQFSGGMAESAKFPVAGSYNAGGSMVFEYLVQPQQFTTLRSGGPDNEFLVDAIIFQGGRSWNVVEKGKTERRNYLQYSFNQLKGQ